MKKILMVCLGNICRSPVAEGVMKHHAQKQKLEIKVASAGTSGFHEGERPDKRSTSNAMLHGIDITNQRSRPVRKDDFENFDLVFAMDHSNYENLLALADAQYHHKIKMILNESHPGENLPVPDPYFGNDGFEEVFQLINGACEIIAQKLKNNEY
ncbi:MAG: low molecular weight phosphotyrosine protein phosphatase [Bacteroidetes bacterium]|nr:low molecular weight phosphotyrosine protein phosphatase [Bacteroidota bacterium]